MDKEMVNDDLVGIATIKLDEIFTKLNINQWYRLMYKAELAGSIHVEMQFVDSAPQQQPP
jgi:hypothetical protein